MRKSSSEPDTQPESNPSTVQAEPDATSANSEPTQDGSQILINIDKSRQEMTVFVDGIEQYTWPVSTGGPRLCHAFGNLHCLLYE